MLGTTPLFFLDTYRRCRVKLAAICFVVAALNYPTSPSAEVTFGPALVYDEPSGTALLVIEDSVRVEAGPLKAGWYQVKLWVLLSAGGPLPKLRQNTVTLEAGTILHNLDGQEYGRTKHTVVVKGIGFSGRGRVTGDIVAYLKESNIRADSVVEPALEQILNVSGKISGINGFGDHLSKFGYKPWREGRFEAFLLGEHSITDPSPGPRIILFFHRESGDLAAILHRRNLKLGDAFEPDDGPRGLRVGYRKHLERANRAHLESHYFRDIQYSD